MNTLINMDPWSLFDDLLGSGSRTIKTIKARAAGHFPPVNVYLDDDAVIIDLELPGKSAKDIDLSLEPQAVIISDRPVENAGENGAVATKQAPAWSRRIELPFRVNADKANAKFTNGILRIELPKAEAVGVRKITIQ